MGYFLAGALNNCESIVPKGLPHQNLLARSLSDLQKIYFKESDRVYLNRFSQQSLMSRLFYAGTRRNCLFAFAFV